MLEVPLKYTANSAISFTDSSVDPKMGSGASKGRRSTLINVKNDNNTTVFDNRNIGRAQRISSKSPTHRGSGRPDSTPTTPSTAIFPTTSMFPPNVQSITVQPATSEEDPMLTNRDAASPSLSSVSSQNSSKSVSDELDNLRTELDQVLIGHYYAMTKPASGVLRNAEIAVLERHNQLKPLPLDYQPPVGNPDMIPGPSKWVRPEDLIRQEKELLQKMTKEHGVKTEAETGKRSQKTTHGKQGEDKTSSNPSTMAVCDLEYDDDQSKTESLDIYKQATYKNYSSAVKEEEATKRKESENSILLPGSSEGRPSPKTVTYDESEEALLNSIERELI
ncbi:uncharacterized protein [Diadema setosum]|uniref:uncharacterized protein isoform X2 n=1 Tax=Diadema setosum TaxID=31175 RepID=UPI003B3B6019